MGWDTSLYVDLPWRANRERSQGEARTMKLRMRTKFLLSMLLITAGLTWTSLLLVRRSVQAQVKKEHFC